MLNRLLVKVSMLLISLVKGEVVMLLRQRQNLRVHLLVLTLTHQLLLVMGLLMLLLKLWYSLLLLMAGMVLLLCLLLSEIKVLVVQWVLLMKWLLLLLLLGKRVINIPILVLVSPHWTATVAEQSISLWSLAQGGTVVLTMLLCHTPITCGPRARKGLPYGVLGLNSSVVAHLLPISRHSLLGERG